MFRNYIKAMFRHAWNHKSYSFLNIFGLAIGIACAGLIFLWVEDEVHYDTVFLKRDRICQVMTNQTFDGITRTFLSTPGPLAPAIQKEIPGIVNACRTNNNKPLLSLETNLSMSRGCMPIPLFSAFSLCSLRMAMSPDL